MKKRILSVLLSLVMVVGLLPTAALAAESTPGSSADNPVVCTTYAQFKAAMEDWDVSYVKIKDIGKNSGGEVLPSHTGLAIGATVYSRALIKHLIIEGESTLIAPLKHSAYQCLIYVGNGANLHVSGSGSLTFKANTDYSTNALIENHGECTVKSGTLRGTYNSDVYGYAIMSTANSKLTINGGSFYGGVASSKLEFPFGAVWVGDESEVTINGGTFESEVYSGITIDEYATNNALIVNESADCKITGGATFVNGIRLIKKSYTPTKYLSELLADGLCMVAQDRTTDSYQVYSPDSNATNVDDLIWVVTKPTLTSVTVNDVVVAGYNVSTGYGETTVKANEETTVTATFNIPSWVNANKVDVKNVICGVVSNTSESTSGALTWNGDKTTATTTVTFTPEAGKTYTFMNAIAVGTSPNYFAILPANLKMDVEVPPEPLIGTVTYTGAARYGAPLTANVSGLPTGVDEDDLTYQWLEQTTVNGKKAWKSIRGATSETYTPTEDMVGKTIRVKVSAEGYLGSIYGAEKKVEKAFNYGTPTAPQLSCTGTTITVGDWKDAQEYCYTTTAPGSKVTWPEGGAGTEIGKEDKSFTGTAGTTYYVYTRIAATDTTLAGTTVRVSSIKVPTTDSSGGEDDVYATGLIYPGYPSTPRTIYVKKGDTVDVKYQITPANANKNLPTWKERSIGDGYPYLTVSQTAQNTASGIGTITIKGDKTTSADGVPVTPYKNDFEQWGTNNDLTVVVYDPNDLTSVPLTSTDLGSVDLYVGDTYDLKLDTLKSTLNFLPAGGSKDGYTLKAYVLKSNPTGAPSYESADSYISINSDTGVITANAATTTGSMVYVVALAESETASVNRYIATLTVKVEAKPTVALESITVNPPSLTLAVGSSKTLTAIKNPINAAGDESITWSSNNTGVATVNSSTGEVTAVAEGKATITATCDGKSAECIVNVAATGHEHSYTWEKQNEYFHKGTCGCGKTALESHHWKWVVDIEATADAVGKMHEECKECKAKRNENTEIPKLTFTVTMNGIGDGASGTGNYEKGTSVTIKAGTKDGYTFKNWTSDDGVTFANANNAETTFTMPEKAVTVTANWTKNSSGGGGGSYTPSYAITVESTKNGDVTVSPKSASKGATVTVTVAPDKGYDLETLTVLDKDGKEIKLTDKDNGKYTFTMPASKVTVKGTFMEDNTMLNFFVDVPADAYYYDAVLWAAKEGITGGVDAVHFAPNAACTRAQIVTFLWRAAGCPEPKAASSFSDVSADAYYAKAVAWAVENGITGGIGGNKFAPDLTCTRAQAVTFLYRAAGSPAVSGGTTFSDVSAEAYYANAVAWAAANGITGGIGGGLFGSNNDCTRAQIVTFLYRSVK